MKKIISILLISFSFFIFISSLALIIIPAINNDNIISNSKISFNKYLENENRLMILTNRLYLPTPRKKELDSIEKLLQNIDYEVDWIKIDGKNKTICGSTICYDSNKKFTIISARKNNGAEKRDIAFHSPYSSIGIDLPGFFYVDSPLSPICNQIYSLDLYHDLFVYKNSELYYLKDAYDLGIITKEDLNIFDCNYISFYNFTSGTGYGKTGRTLAK